MVVKRRNSYKHFLISTHGMVKYIPPSSGPGLRYNARVRSQDRLKADFNAKANAAPAGGLNWVVGSNAWHAVPPQRNTAMRPVQQGMGPAMSAINPGASTFGATEYADFLRAKSYTLSAAPYWHWCHMVGHALGGGAGPTNILAGTKQNNAEQMAFENALGMYMTEVQDGSLTIHVRVRGTRMDLADARHMGDVIRYDISVGGLRKHTHYLDCQPKLHSMPNEHFSTVYHEACSFLNEAVSHLSHRVRPLERRAIRRYIELHS